MGILFIGKKVTNNKIGKLILISLVIKTINMVFLSISNNCTNKLGMQIGIIVDVILERLITISIYPFICTIRKDDNLYSKRKLIEYLFKDIGILVGGICIGRVVFGYFIDYNMCLIISVLFSVLSVIAMLCIKGNNAVQDKIEEKRDIIKYIKKHRLLRIYLLYNIFGNIAMNTGLGLKMLMLTNMFGFTASNATTYLLIIGLIADLVGILALKFLTPKDDYLTVFIKFGIRMLAYIIAFVTNNVYICLIAITWSILISTAYENVMDGKYINTVDKEYQLLFNNAMQIASIISTAIGLFFAGIMYDYGVRYLLGLSAFFMFFQITFANTLIYMRKHKKEGD